MPPKQKHILLRSVPDDIYNFLLKENNKNKEQKKVAQFSTAQTLYCILRSTEAFKNFLKTYNK